MTWIRPGETWILPRSTHPHFELRLFPTPVAPLRMLEMLTRFGSVTRRMHNKSFTVDGVVTVVGGRNIGDEYFSADPTVEFGDLDVLGAGPVATDVSAVFDAYWNHSLAYPASTLSRETPTPTGSMRFAQLRSIAIHRKAALYAERLRASPLVEQLATPAVVLHWGRAKVFADGPDKLLTSPDDRSTHMGPRLQADVAKMTASEVLIFALLRARRYRRGLARRPRRARRPGAYPDHPLASTTSAWCTPAIPGTARTCCGPGVGL